jgi:uncharacterized beta-barrel protein YwiB (DUF1934 family)
MMMMSDIQRRNGRKLVSIEATYTHTLNGTVHTIEELSGGSLFQVDDETFLVAFDTFLNDKKLTTTIKFSNNVMTRVQIGETHTRQNFAEDEWYAVQYFYEGSLLLLRSYTNRLDCALTPEGGVIDLLYELWSGDSFMGHYNMELFIS